MQSSLKRGFLALKDKCISMKNRKTNKSFDEISKFLSEIKQRQEEVESKINNVHKSMVFRDEFTKLERSLEQEKSLSILHDMQLYVDEAIASLSSKFKTEICLQLKNQTKMINSKT